jgi:hypothetical protein
MRLLSFLSDIERAVVAGAPAGKNAWEATRMVNFHHGLARLTLKPRAAGEGIAAGGSIFLQSFALADGSLCLKASLNWNGSDAVPVLAVYSTPTLNWKTEAVRIATEWLAGPPAQASVTPADMTTTDQTVRKAAAG